MTTRGHRKQKSLFSSWALRATLRPAARAHGMKKYWHVINVGLQNNLTYRFNFLARTLFGFIPLTAVLMLWRTIYSTKGADATVANYTLAQMTS